MKVKSQKSKVKSIDPRRGFVLPFSVLLAGILLSIGLAIFSITLKELILSSSGRESQFAFFAADAGTECALYWDTRHTGFATSAFDTYANTQPVSQTSVCATANENSSAALTCPNGQTIKDITFASYGTPAGQCGNFSVGSCHAATSATVVGSACIGKSSCTVPANNTTFGDPCYGTYKRLYIQALCEGPGSSSAPTDGLVSYWKLDDGTGTTAADSQGNSTGTLTNGPLWTTGKISGGVNFDGANDYIGIGAPPMLVTDNWTLAAWMNPANLNQFGFVVQNGEDDAQGSNDGYGFGVGSGFGSTGGKLQAVAAGIQWLDSGYTFPSANTWYHVVMMRSAGATKFYVNGAQTANTFTTSYLVPTRQARIGSQNGIRYFAGKIDEVRMYNRALSPSEVASLYIYTGPAQGSGVHEPVAQNSGVMCSGADISSPATGYTEATGWDYTTLTDGVKTVFDMAFQNDTCANVTVTKAGGTTQIDSRGYNTCNQNNPRRVERGLRVVY